MKIAKDKKKVLIGSVIGIIIFLISSVGFYFLKFYTGIIIILPSVVINITNIRDCIKSSRNEEKK